MWSALVLGLTTLFARPPACDLASLDKLRASLTQAYLDEEFDRVLELAECELRALRSAPAWLRDPLDGSPEHPCKPLEVIFNVCNEQRPALGCAQATLVRHAREGCSEMPGFAVEHHRMRAQYHHRRLEYAEEFAALAAAADRAAEDAVCWYEETGPADPAIELAITEAQRGQLAAELRGWHVLRESVAAAERLLAQASQPNPSTAADIRNLLAWAMLLAREAGGDAGDPTPQLAAALDTFEALQHRAATDNVRINLGLAALQRGALEDVEPTLAAIDADDLQPEQALWLHLVRVRAALAAGRARQAQPSLRVLARIARSGLLPTARWHAAWARGLAQESAGKLRLAADAYQKAEAELERLAHGRLASQDAATADRAMLNLGDAARRLIRAQIALGDPEAAADSARHARTRALRVAARESCRAAERVLDDPPSPGELRLLYFPASPQTPTGRSEKQDVWAGFAITSRGVRAELLTLPATPPGPAEDLAGWSKLLLEPFRAEITGSSAVVVLPSGHLNEVPFHELPWDGDILLASRPVLSGLDIETCGGDLQPGAAAQILRGPEDHDFVRETRQVEREWTAAGHAAHLTLPRSAGDLALLLQGPARLVHIAAHGEQIAGDRLFMADDRIRFSDGLVLTRADILSATAPAVVFLSSCRSSSIDAETLGGGLSLAQAFMLRGASFVVGATGDLDGEVATDFAPRFYRALAGRPVSEVPAAWREAYLQTRAELTPRRKHLMRMLRVFAR
ncbi:CHAT domain-containing protein [Nannocystis pusilla]